MRLIYFGLNMLKRPKQRKCGTFLSESASQARLALTSIIKDKA
jgi:hypothetical protein